jgi:DNA-binding helix-hairpin-helix protein with protein kinase domain
MDLAWLSAEIRGLFERSLAGRLEDRARASEWHSALRRLEDSLVACPENEAHEYPAEAEACPFCRLERDLRIGFFGRGELSIRGDSGIVGRVEELRELIVEGKEAFPPAPDFRLSEGRKLSWREKVGGASYRTMPAWLTGSAIIVTQAPAPVMAGVLSASALGAVGLAVSGMPLNQLRLKRRYGALMRERSELEAKWASVAGASSLIKAAQEAIAESHALRPGGPREQELEREMMRQVFGPSLLAFLRKSSISASHVDAVTATVERSLRAAGIRSIADVSEESLSKVDGISSRIRSDLLGWRRHLEEHYWATTPHSLPPERLRRLEAILSEDRRRCAEMIDRLSRSLPDRIAQEVAEREQILGRTALIDREIQEMAPQMKALEKAMGGIQFLP